jgi:hypothetical protein
VCDQSLMTEIDSLSSSNGLEEKGKSRNDQTNLKDLLSGVKHLRESVVPRITEAFQHFREHMSLYMISANMGTMYKERVNCFKLNSNRSLLHETIS